MDWLTGPVAITGADGHVGTFVQERLAESPNEVRPLGRAADLVAGFSNADAVIHLAGTLQATGGNAYEDANLETVRKTVAALAGSSVRRVVFLSYVGADPGSDNRYLRAKGEAERLILGCGRPAAVVRSTFIYGPPANPGPSATPFSSKDGKRVSVIGSGRQRYAPAFVGDVAEALIRLALDPATPTGTFAIAGPQAMTVDEFADALSGADVAERHLPRRLARALAHVVPSLTPTMVDVLAADSLADGPLVSDALGLELHALTDVYARRKSEGLSGSAR
jgi:NADH dehydrogenase